MALDYPPDGWGMNVGTWGTDADEDTTNHKSGGRSIKIYATAVSTEAGSLDFTPVEGGKKYLSETETRSSSNNGAHTYSTGVYWYDENKAPASTAWNYLRAVTAATAADTWEIDRTIITAPSDARFARLFLWKNTTSSYTVNYDRITFVRAIPSWSVYEDTAWQIPSASWDLIEFNTTTTAETIDVTHDDAGIITIATPGFYVFSARVAGDDSSGILADEYLILRAVKNSGGVPVVLGYGTQAWNHHASANRVVAPALSGFALLEAGDTIEVQAYSSSGAADIYVTEGQNYFKGALVAR